MEANHLASGLLHVVQPTRKSRPSGTPGVAGIVLDLLIDAHLLVISCLAFFVSFLGDRFMAPAYPYAYNMAPTVSMP